MGLIRLLFLADTHLGFDLPYRPRVERRRRGEDFFRNYHKVLEHARRREVHAVIHGGDLFFRSRVPAQLVDAALEPLREIAESGIKVFLVPGNHERSRIPFGIFSAHPHIHIFNRPVTYMAQGEKFRLALSGFPYWRENIRERFPEVLEETGWREKSSESDAHLLCVHHCFEGATVGPQNFTFRYNKDVIKLADIPKRFSAVLSGHIHRYQVLERDLLDRPLSTPVFFPGSIERTSMAEAAEAKGYMLLEVRMREGENRPLIVGEFKELFARPMVRLRINVEGLRPESLRNTIRQEVGSLSRDSIVKIRFEGVITEDLYPVIRSEALRKLCPPEMNVSLQFSAVKSCTAVPDMLKMSVT